MISFRWLLRNKIKIHVDDELGLKKVVEQLYEQKNNLPVTCEDYDRQWEDVILELADRDWNTLTPKQKKLAEQGFMVKAKRQVEEEEKAWEADRAQWHAQRNEKCVVELEKKKKRETKPYHSYENKYLLPKWRQNNLDLIRQNKVIEELRAGETYSVVLVNDGGNDHITGWKSWTIPKLPYSQSTLTYDVPSNTTVIGFLLYRGSNVVQAQKIAAQSFRSQGTYTLTLTFTGK